MNLVEADWRNIVDGKRVAGEGDGLAVLNPASGETMAQVRAAGPADVDAAVGAARRAVPEWSETTPRERAELLLRLAEAVREHGDELARVESLNVGKPLSMARDEVSFCFDNLSFLAGAARCLGGRASGEYVRGYTSWIRREPVGVVGSIAPWNYPLMVAVWKVGPALAAGNTCVLKPAEQTPLTALMLGAYGAEILPRGVLNVISGEGEPAGAAIVRHPEVDMVSLTGAITTGKEVARAAAEGLKRVHLELGGKAPALVFDDADPAAVADGVKLAGYWNAGQECAAACRVLASATIYDRLLEELVPAVESIKVGDPSEGEDVDMGPLISREQQRRVLGFIDRATSAGRARLLTGGGSNGGRGFFVEPSIVVDVGQADEIVQTEVFGPVVTVQRFSSDEDALACANGVNQGLSASVWTRDVGRALNAARKLRFGTVWINDHLALASEMPWTGMKQSGYGHDMSVYALEDYTQIKHVMAKID